MKECVNGRFLLLRRQTKHPRCGHPPKAILTVFQFCLRAGKKSAPHFSQVPVLVRDYLQSITLFCNYLQSSCAVHSFSFAEDTFASIFFSVQPLDVQNEHRNDVFAHVCVCKTVIFHTSLRVFFKSVRV